MSTSSIAISRKAALLSRLLDYAELTRPKIAVMVVAASTVAVFAAGEGAFSPVRLAASMLGVLLVAASASSFNQWLERKSDALMARTRDRPLPAGRVSGFEVNVFAILALVAGEICLAALVTISAAVWAAATWAAYVWCYTPLKSRTWWNTVVGAIAGAMPVFIGWTSAQHAANPLTEPVALALFGIVFLWQFPHFMAIAWIYRRDYGDAGLKMLTVVDPTGRRAGRLAAVTALALIGVSLAPLAVGLVTTEPRLPGGWEIAGLTAAAAMGIGQLACAIAFASARSDRAARRLLHASLLYLPAMLVLFLCLSP